MTRNSPKRDYGPTLIVLVAAAIVGVGAFAFSLRQIFVGVRGICEIATTLYGGDRVEALIALIESENASFKEKNRAIWALGQIGDRRALPLLHRLDTDEVQPKPYDPDRSIVQYSVEKAIRQIENSFILTRWMYRWL
jgi:hypothetical protein